MKYVAVLVGFWFIVGPMLVALTGAKDVATIWGIPFIGLWLTIGGLGAASWALRKLGH